MTVTRPRTFGNELDRCAVLPSSVSPSGNGMNGLGEASRDSGHSRVPAPPDRITGTMGVATEVGIGGEGREVNPPFYRGGYRLPRGTGVRVARGIVRTAAAPISGGYEHCRRPRW